MNNEVRTIYMPDTMEPSEVFRYFAEIAAIPHGSGNTAAISSYLAGFAGDHGLKYRQDDMGNVIIWKDGRGNKPVILQGHMDMVCEKAPGCDKDMVTEELDLYIDGDKLKAKDTTLGGDDGIAVAMALAILDSADESLPPIEAIFTVDEEIGMLGAAAIDVSDIKGRIMINIDSEEEGVFTVSCAGGAVAHSVIDLTYENTIGTKEAISYKIEVSGLTGGHSGIEIHKNRANAIVVLGRVLQELKETLPLRIVDIEGGAKDNAIPVYAGAQVIIPVDDGRTEDEIRKLVSEAVGRITEAVGNEYSSTDGNIHISCDEISRSTFSGSEVNVTDQVSTDRVIYMLTCLPNGIQRMSPDVEGLVQTSLNMGILKKEKDLVTLTFCVRSSVASEKEMLKRRLMDAMKAIGGRTEFEGEYPGWQYRTDSALRDMMKEVFVGQYGYEPKIEAVHAGVECGFFADKLQGLDCVSIGPELSEIHTFRESMDIPSVGRTYELVTETLKKIAES